jgi:hypothetical protein
LGGLPNNHVLGRISLRPWSVRQSEKSLACIRKKSLKKRNRHVECLPF